MEKEGKNGEALGTKLLGKFINSLRLFAIVDTALFTPLLPYCGKFPTVRNSPSKDVGMACQKVHKQEREDMKVMVHTKPHPSQCLFTCKNGADEL